MAYHLITTLVLGLLTNNVLSDTNCSDTNCSDTNCSDTNCSDTNYRLNSLVKPFCYYITITPYFDSIHGESALTFDGKVSIIISPNVNTNQIKMHSKNLTFGASNVTVSNDQAVNPVTTLEFDTKYDFVYINLQNELQAGVEYTLKILYTGVMRKDHTGFYVDGYYTNVPEKLNYRRLGATHMEPTSARKVFPCFDEPAYKAVFTLVIDRPNSFNPSVTNMKLYKAVPLSNGYVREIFYPSPKMSTYLVAFLISDYETTRSHSGNFGIYTRPEAKNQTEYALNFGVKAVNALSDYFGIDYYSTDSHLKLDHVALPHHLRGAMENWGLVTYREYNLLYDPEESTPLDKLMVSQVLAHETAHMWFGNLVTCHWWSDVWLSEGFAEYFGNYITDIIEPEIGAGDSMITHSVYEGYNDDESPTSPAISNDANSPDEIVAKFGKIVYHKGSSVIRMIHHLLGDKAFQLGLQAYLKENKFKLGYPYKLYTSLHQAVINTSALADYPGSNIAGIMAPWITQAGHPILTVNIDYDNKTVILTQKRFYINSSYESNETYPIPVTYTSELAPDFNNTKPAFIMNEKSRVLNLTGLGAEHWVIFNIQETGFYRVNYDERAWKKIANALKGKQREIIHHLNRAKIVNDLFAFANSRIVKYELLYDVLEFLNEEASLSVWQAAIRGLNNLIKSKFGTAGQKEVKAYALRLVGGIIAKLGYEVRTTDDFATLINRMQVLAFACKLGHQGCIDNALAQFKSFKENGTEISPSLRPVVYCHALRHGTAEDDVFLHQRLWFATNLASEAFIIRTALKCPEDKNRRKKYYEVQYAKKKLQKKQHLNV